MTRSSATSVPHTLLTIVRAFPRMLPRTAVLLVAIIGVMIVALALAVTLAAPSAEQIAQTLAQGTGTATLQLVLASTWWLVPFAVMFVAMLVFTGMLLHFADAAVSGKWVHSLTALAATLARIHVAAMVAITYAVTAFLALVGAPLISLVALIVFLLIVVTERLGRRLPGWVPARRTTALLIIPFFLVGAVIIRWSLAFGDVFLSRNGWRESLRMSWERTAGRVRLIGVVLLIAFGGTIVISWGLMVLGTLTGSAGVELGIQLLSSLLVAPIPAITLLVLFRRVGGPASPVVESVGDTPRMSPRRFGPGIPAAVSFALVLTLLTPPPTATAAEGPAELPPVPTVEVEQGEDVPPADEVPPSEQDAGDATEPETDPEPESVPGATVPAEELPVAGSFVVGQPDRDLSLELFAPKASSSFAPMALEATVVTFTGASEIPWEWTFGDTYVLDGTVAASGVGSKPSGTVQLWGNTLDLDDPAYAIGDAVALIDGRFAFDATKVLPKTRKLWVEYGGDSTHEAAAGEEQLVNVRRVILNGQATVLQPAGTIAVGDRVVLRIDVDPDGRAVPGHPPSGALQLMDSGAGTVLAAEELVNGTAIIEFVMTKRSIHLATVGVDDTPYWMYLGGGEFTLVATPAATTTTLTVQQSVSLGTDAVVVADVSRPGGVPVAGVVEFSYKRGMSSFIRSLGSVAVTADGQAALTFCVGDIGGGSSAGACPSLPRAIVPDSPPALRVVARFTPDPADESSRPLLPSDSPWIPINVQPAGSGGTGVCKVVEINSLVLGMTQATENQRASVGDPALQTKSNCSTTDFDGNLVTGLRDGTVLTVQARPKAGYELVEWRHNGAVIGTQSTLVWLMPDAPLNWRETIEPIYQPRCLTVDLHSTGHATPLRAIPRSNPNPLAAALNCWMPDGTLGAYVGSLMEAGARGDMNLQTGEPDVIFSARANGTPITPTGASTDQRTGLVSHELWFTLRHDTVVHVDYGPTCRTVQTHTSYFTPAEEGGQVNSFGDEIPADAPLTGVPELLTAPGCSTPLSSGWYRNSEVTVLATPENQYAVVAGWRVNGELREELGIEPRVTVVVGDSDVTTIEYDISYCYPVHISVRQDTRRGVNASESHVGVSPVPNCTDGSDRYAQGTEVDMWPERGRSALGAKPMSFAGWTDDVIGADGNKVGERISAVGMNSVWHQQDSELAAGTVNGRTGVRVVEIEAPLITTASFYAEEACSNITVGGGLRLADLTFSDTSCGPGRYFDRAKLNLPTGGDYYGPVFQSDGSPLDVRDGRYGENFHQEMRKQHYEFDDLTHPYTSLSFSVPGTILDVYGQVKMTQDSPSSEQWRWSATEDLSCTGASCEISVRGDVRIELAACQGLDVKVNLSVAGDMNETVYTPKDLGLDDFDWVVSDTPSCGGQSKWSDGKTVVLRAQAPSVGLEFIDWGEVDNLVGLEWFVNHEPGDPRAPLAVQVKADDSEKNMKVELNFSVHCATIKLDAMGGVVGPAPNCPGATTELDYIVGTFVSVASSIRNIEGRRFVRFHDNQIIAGTGGTIEMAPKDVIGFNANRGWVKEMNQSVAQTKYLNKNPPISWWPQFPEHNFHTGIILVQRDGQFTQGYYQYPDNGWESFGKGMANVGKLMVGVTSLALTAAMPFCPPCAVAVTALTLSEFLVRLLPAGDFLGNIIAMANPMNFIECSTKWGFGSLDGSDSSAVTKKEFGTSFAGAVAVGTKSAYKENIVINDPSKLDRFEKWTKAGKSGAAMATFAYGLYENKLWEVQLTDSTASEFRDTAAYEQCLSDTWKDPTPS